MSKLNMAIEQLVQVKGDDWEKIALASNHFVETLSLSSSEEIKGMIKYVYEHYYMKCPFWAKLIAFRILLLQNPNDEEAKQWATADAEMFGGPEWKEAVGNW
jgi:hypothetical protein